MSLELWKRGSINMSNQQNDYIIETFYEDFLEKGHSEKQAQKLAQEKFENEGWAQNMIKKQKYQAILECILSGQVSSNTIALYFKDKKFYQYYRERKDNGNERN